MPNDGYISREAAFQLCSDAQGKAGSKAELAGISKIWHGLKRLPAADVAPVVRGEWIEERGYYVCSACGQAYDDNQTLSGEVWRSCPMCFARMDGGEHRD